MGKQRKYLDRGRRIRLEGRPMEPDWLTLLGAGREAVREGTADSCRYLDEVMWEGVDPMMVTPRPALFDHPFLRSALDTREEVAVEYLHGQWDRAWVDPLPDSAAEIRDMLELPDCAKRSRSHLMTAYGAKLPEGTVTWYAGYCAACMRAMLLRIDDDAFTVRWWPFYDHEAEYAGADPR